MRCLTCIDPGMAALAGDLLDYCERHGIDIRTVDWNSYETELLPKIAEERRQGIIKTLFDEEPILNQLDFRLASPGSRTTRKKR